MTARERRPLAQGGAWKLSLEIVDQKASWILPAEGQMIRAAVIAASLDRPGRDLAPLMEASVPWGAALGGGYRGSHAEVISFDLPPKPVSDRGPWTIQVEFVVARLSLRAGSSGRFYNVFGSTDLVAR